MTKKEMENAMFFIIEQQSQFALNQESLDKRVSRLEGAVVTVINMIGELTKAQQRSEDKLNQLMGKLNELIDAQAQTEERLNIFINVVERHISEGQNGNEQ